VDERAERYWIPRRHAQAITAMLVRHCAYASREHLRESLLAQYPASCSESNRLWHRRQSRLLSRFVAGTDMFGSESNGDSVTQQYRDLGLNLRPASRERVCGWSAILQRLGDPADGLKPTLFIHQRCKHLVECLPCLKHTPDRGRCAEKSGGDQTGHHPDGQTEGS
jgi:hypothetical protein